MIELKIPKLGLTMENATLLSWGFSSGDEVKKDEIIFVIETDKVTFEVPAPNDGILHPVAKIGEQYDVDQTVGYLAESREEYESLLRDYPLDTQAHEKKDEQEQDFEVKKETFPSSPALEKGRRKASPLARSMASSHGLDLSKIKGTGPGGRIVRSDILRSLEGKKTAVEMEPSVPKAFDKDFIGKETAEAIPISGIRRAIYDNMFMSISQTAQLTLHTEAIAKALIDLRARLNSRIVKDEAKISYNAIMVKIVAVALRLHPNINVSVKDDEIKIWKQIHIGVAMELEDALVVPVLRNPDLKSIREINDELNALIIKTRENRLIPDDLVNGTFTLSNLGFADIDYFTPILRPPESGILGVGRILEKPVVIQGEILAGPTLGLSLTFDHRIIDGAPAARFLKTVKDIFEEPLLMV